MKIINNEEFAEFRGTVYERIVSLEKSMEILTGQNEQLMASAERSEILINEILWSQIFGSTITNSKWLTDKTFSPGRWAVCYAFLYILYRVLDEIHPTSILETGLGQSTRMIAQYAAEHACSHLVVEQDKEWIDFFSNSYSLPENTKLMHLPVQEKEFMGDKNTLVYSGFAEKTGSRKYDFICIDGPGKSKSQMFGRVDIMDVLPGALSPKWIILWDDDDISFLHNTYLLLLEKLQKENIPFAEGEYRGTRRVKILCSPDIKFLTSL
ncbi:MAG: hypothetical protein WCP73_06570 [Eubacteriales bacterium]